MFTVKAVILLLPHPASFAHNFVSWMQSFYFSEYCRLVIKNSVLDSHKFAVRLIDTGF